MPLVTGQDASQLRVSSGVTASGAADGNPVAFTRRPGRHRRSPGCCAAGPGGIAELLDTTLPSYVAGLDAVAADLADALNAQHAAGFDLAGTAGGPLFGYDPADPAGSLKVVITDPAKLAASGVPGGGLDAGNADDLADAITVDGAYQRLVNGFGNTVASVQRLSATQQALTTQVDRAREQLAGVSLDEETVNMISAAARLRGRRAGDDHPGLGPRHPHQPDRAGALMTVGRVTQNMMSQQSLAGMQAGLGRLAKTQEQLTTGRIINRPSDDPTRRRPPRCGCASRCRSSSQYVRNADDGMGWLDQVDTTLGAMADARYAGPATSPCRAPTAARWAARAARRWPPRSTRSARACSASANTTYLDRPIFGGVTAGATAYDAGRHLHRRRPARCSAPSPTA